MEHNTPLFNLKSYENISENQLDKILELAVISETYSDILLNNKSASNNEDGFLLNVTNEPTLESIKKPVFEMFSINNTLPNLISLNTLGLKIDKSLISSSINDFDGFLKENNVTDIGIKHSLINNSEKSYNMQFRKKFEKTQQNVLHNLTSTPKLYSMDLNQHQGTRHYLSPNITAIPHSLQELYKSIKNLYSDFSFVYVLSAQMCQDIVPMNSFIILKIALVLSLASTNDVVEDSVMPIPIIAIGKETSLINQIMIKFKHVSKRFINGFQGNTSFVGIELVKKNTIEGGLMFLARGGVCYFGSWCSVKSFNEDKVCKILEYGKTNLESSNKIHKIHCAVWSYWIVVPKKCKENLKLIKFLEVFGIPILVDENETLLLSNFILEKNLGKLHKINDELSLPENDIKFFLTEISRRPVKMSKEASILLQKYFIICRKERPGYLSQRAFTTLYQFSESFAKLCLRHEVLKIDVVGAIFMAENSLNKIIGPGHRKLFPPEFLPANNLVENIEIYIRNFEMWLDKYVEL